MMSPGEQQHLVYTPAGGTAADPFVGAPPAGQPDAAAQKPKGCCGIPLPKSAAVMIRVVGLILCLTVIVVQVFLVFSKLATFDIHEFLLSAYIMLFASCCLFAELRFIELCRRCTASCMKYVAFVNSVLGRGFFYIFMGSLLLDSVLGWVLGLATIICGFANIAMAVCCRDQIPVYYDEIEGGAAPTPYVALPANGQGGAVQQPPAGNPFAASPAGAAAQFVYDNRQHITAENAQAAAQFYQDNKQHMTKENLDRAQKVAQVFSYK